MAVVYVGPAGSEEGQEDSDKLGRGGGLEWPKELRRGGGVEH
jgi:hypothetical protein